MRKFFVAALVAGAATTPAMAQDASPFTGLRVEGVIGYDTLRSGEDNDEISIPEGEDESIDGVTYGVGVGYDFNLGGVVAGVEGEFADSSGNQEADEPVETPLTTRISVGRDLYVGGRIGFTVTPSTLLYAKGGYINTKIDAAFEDDTDTFDFDAEADGFRLGAGIEQTFGTNAYGKVEYRYSNYNDLHLEDGDFETDIDLDRHQIVAGVGLRF